VSANRDTAPGADRRALLLNPNDTVVVATEDIGAGLSLEALGLVTVDRIAQGHKIARHAHSVGDPVIRYGQMIGRASVPITVGEHVHSHNLAMGDQADDGAVRLDAGDTSAFQVDASG
jgi:altronate hydrolase